jgi:hypothetical protein
MRTGACHRPRARAHVERVALQACEGLGQPIHRRRLEAPLADRGLKLALDVGKRDLKRLVVLGFWRYEGFGVGGFRGMGGLRCGAAGPRRRRFRGGLVPRAGAGGRLVRGPPPFAGRERAWGPAPP